MELIKWDIYEIKSKNTSLNGIMLRGRIRKFCLEKNRNILAENTEDIENSVRFAVPSGESISELRDYLAKIISGSTIELVMKEIGNPVLSKLKVNLTERYDL